MLRTKIDIPQRLPRLLGSEANIKLDEKQIADQIKANFKDPLDNSHSIFENNDSSSLNESKKDINLKHKNRFHRLTSVEAYDINNKSQGKSIHSNEAIMPVTIINDKARPRSSKLSSKRPWSNRSYRKQKTGSSSGVRPATSKRTIFSTQKSNSLNSRKNSSRRFNKHLSKVDDIIGQVDRYAKFENKAEKKMPRKYCGLQTNENIDISMGVYGTKAQNERQSFQMSVHSDRHRPNGKRTSHSQPIRIVKNSHSKNIGGIPVNHITHLFQAKCKDLELVPKEGQLKRFYDFCSNAIKHRKYNFKEIGLGVNSARVLGVILRLNKCSHLDLRKNLLGNKGIIELAKSINTNSSLVHIDIGSNDITFEGANSFFLSLRKHKSLTSINIANSDGLHRNRIGSKG
jgi:hypothetical protein